MFLDANSCLPGNLLELRWMCATYLDMSGTAVTYPERIPLIVTMTPPSDRMKPRGERLFSCWDNLLHLDDEVTVDGNLEPRIGDVIACDALKNQEDAGKAFLVIGELEQGVRERLT